MTMFKAAVSTLLLALTCIPKLVHSETSQFHVSCLELLSAVTRCAQKIYKAPTFEVTKSQNLIRINTVPGDYHLLLPCYFRFDRHQFERLHH